ncbi:MAG: hypothetical protein Q9182_000818 [Xanthomendoza sp. 2 TL-2023]
MLSIQRPKSEEQSSRFTLNLLPCRIHHDGPINTTPRYWDPTTDKDGHPEGYFRGRKLKGREVSLPVGYRGAVVRKGAEDNEAQKKIVENQPSIRMEDDDGDPEDEVKVLEEVTQFDELVVWGHEAIAESDDTFVKGVEEWVKLARAMHAPGRDEESESGKR